MTKTFPQHIPPKLVGKGAKKEQFTRLQQVEYWSTAMQVVALANLLPQAQGVDELDSFMYQTVGHQLIDCYAQCTGLPLFRRRITGTSKHQATPPPFPGAIAPPILQGATLPPTLQHRQWLLLRSLQQGRLQNNLSG